MIGALLGRDIRLATRAGGSSALALAFFAAVVTLVPLGIGTDIALLARVAAGVLWVAAVLAALLSLDRLFQADFDDGSLDLLALSPLSLETIAVVKIAAHWLTTGLPLTLLSPLLGAMFGLPPGETGTLALSLLLGTPSVSALGAIGAALTLSIRRGGLILPLLVLPLLAPAVIFGAAAVQAGPDGMSGGALLFLSAFSVATTLLSPFAAAAAVRLNLAG
jgi:heme exporter protein B